MNQEKKTKSGPLLEVDFYPVFESGKPLPERSKKEKRSTKEQEKYNRQQAIKKIVRMVNANFDSTDLLMHPTYAAGNAPADMETARKDIVNYLRRVKTRRASEAKKVAEQLEEAKEAADAKPDSKYLREQVQKLKQQLKKLEAPLKYIYVIEEQVYKTGKRAGCPNYHFHMFVTGGLPRKVMEEMWPAGVRTNADRYQPEKFGPEAAAKYVMKDPQGRRRWAASKNMKKPEERTRKTLMTNHRMEKWARERVDDAPFWERRYKGYKFVRCLPRWNTYNSHWYISVVMYKDTGQPPDWADQWPEE